MGLFNKNIKITQKTATATCPVCGKEHTSTVCEDAPLYLDGTPMMTLEQCLSKFVICDECGYIFNLLSPSGGLLEGQKQEYAAAVATTYDDENLRKLMLLRALSSYKTRGWMWVRYYQEQGKHDVAHTIMREMIANQRKRMTSVGNDAFAYINLPCQFCFYDDYRDVDLLRQLGDFEAANACLKNLMQDARQNNDAALETYLKAEAKLIKKKDTAQY